MEEKFVYFVSIVILCLVYYDLIDIFACLLVGNLSIWWLIPNCSVLGDPFRVGCSVGFTVRGCCAGLCTPCYGAVTPLASGLVITRLVLLLLPCRGEFWGCDGYPGRCPGLGAHCPEGARYCTQGLRCAEPPASALSSLHQGLRSAAPPACILSSLRQGLRSAAPPVCILSSLTGLYPQHYQALRYTTCQCMRLCAGMQGRSRKIVGFEHFFLLLGNGMNVRLLYLCNRK